MVKVINRWLGAAEVALLCVFLASLIGVACFNFVANHLLDYNPMWTDEIIRYSVFFIAWTGAALCAQSDQMLNMDVIARLVKPRTKLLIRAGTRILTIIACIFLVWGAMRVRNTVAGEDYELISKGKVALAFLVGAGMVGLHTFIHLILDVLYLVLRVMPAEEHVSLH